ncbi:MAG: SpoIIAA family protein [Sulfobacillus sp.]
MIRMQSFPDWKGFAAMLVHLKFIKEHIQRIEKVMVIADGALANIMPDITNHFVHTQVRHFDFTRKDAAGN